MTYKGVDFPNIDPIAVHIGDFGIRWYSLAYLAGIMLGWMLMRRMVKRYPTPVTPVMIDDLVFWATIGLIAGGRIGYVLFYNFTYYMENPSQILALWKGGMSFHGGLLGVILAVLFYARSVKVGFFHFTDILACVVPIGLFFGRIANFINSELFGRVTVSVPWAVIFPNGGPLPRHPSQLYEAGFEGVFLFCILYFLWAASVWVRIRPGFVSGLFLFCYALIRGVIENFREPDAQIGFLFARVTMGQMLTVPMLIAGVWIMVWAAKNLRHSDCSLVFDRKGITKTRARGIMPVNFRKRGFCKTIAALIRVKLVIPMIRSKAPPEITARGAMIGMAWAMTPLVGIQMYLVFMTWLCTRKLFKWDFSLPVGLAWTWVTNVFTMPPFYYVFYLTGKAMTGEFAERTTYSKFYNLIKDILNESGMVEALKAMGNVLIKDWGFSMMIGSFPWMVVGSWGAYKWTLWYIRQRRETLAGRLENRQKKLEQKIRDKQEKFVRTLEKTEQKLENKQQKFEMNQKKLEKKLEKTIAAKEDAAAEQEKMP